MKLILTSSKNKYLLGFLVGFCYQTGYQLKTIQKESANIFLKSIKEELPSVVFVDLKQSTRIFNSSEWNEARLCMLDNQTMFCGIGQWLNDSEEAAYKLFFDEIYTEPVDYGKVVKYLNFKMESSSERRTRERRENLERRNLVEDGEVKFPVNISCKTNIDQSDLKRMLHLGSLSLDNIDKIFYVNDVPVKLSPKEFKLIGLLMKWSGRVVNTEDIIKEIWVENKNATKADVHQYIYVLRKKLEKNPDKPLLLITVRGFGYKLCL